MTPDGIGVQLIAVGTKLISQANMFGKSIVLFLGGEAFPENVSLASPYPPSTVGTISLASTAGSSGSSGTLPPSTDLVQYDLLTL